MSDHDELCPQYRYSMVEVWSWSHPNCYCNLIAKVRADEREQVALDTAAGIVDPGLRAVIVDEALTDLHAKAEALEARHPWGPGGTTMVSRADVLDLFVREDT